ncbi:hypothetical protein [Clostridium sp.]|uniref:hypothetical protein n=1 Tax=Clostridium sp. TaxID=1506 RepID=UPI001A5D4C6C|nr:hypothetical protein [Clostridium sp.]MBK5243333.1 hypothetical protein [Clostridium sp.]
MECFDEREHFEAGDKISFNLILIGRTIVYLQQFIFAFDALGQKGIGAGDQKYSLSKIYNEGNDAIFDEGYFYKSNIKINTLKDYVDKIDPSAQSDARTVTINMPEPKDGTPKANQQEVEIPALAVQAMA